LSAGGSGSSLSERRQSISRDHGTGRGEFDPLWQTSSRRWKHVGLRVIAALSRAVDSAVIRALGPVGSTATMSTGRVHHSLGLSTHHRMAAGLGNPRIGSPITSLLSKRSPRLGLFNPVVLPVCPHHPAALTQSCRSRQRTTRAAVIRQPPRRPSCAPCASPRAPTTSNLRRYPSPCLLIPPSRSCPPEPWGFGVSPNHAAN
jgi:hypothetical protein